MKKSMQKASWYVVGVDQGTTSTRAIVYDSSLTAVASHQLKHKQITPHPGWLQHDPLEILRNTRQCIDSAVAAVEKQVGAPPNVSGVGLTNQRETVVVWDKATGKPLHDAIVWCDLRCQEQVDAFVRKYGKEGMLRRTGLPASPYFSAFKLQWLQRHCAAVRDALAAGRALVGTIDSWLLWHLSGGQHKTSVCNASRTFLADIHTLRWDESLCAYFGIPSSALPQIVSNCSDFGAVQGGALDGVPITGMIGDQQAACVGQMCFNEGELKNTFGTGCFLLMNTGTTPRVSRNGLLTTVCYQLGDGEAPRYALEGSVVQAGMLITWLKDNMQIVSSPQEVSQLAAKVKDSGGISIVPAFAGLYAPHWRPDARGVICGLTMFTKREHICRAALTSIAMQCFDVVKAMEADSSMKISALKADGGLANNTVLMQLQADLSEIQVEVPDDKETTALGSAVCAAIGSRVIRNASEAVQIISSRKLGVTHFTPKMEPELRACKIRRWRKALLRSHDWIDNDAAPTAAKL